MPTAAFPLPAAFQPELPVRAPVVRSAADLRSALRTPTIRMNPADLVHLDRVLRLEARSGLVEAQGGVTWKSLADYLAAQAETGLPELAAIARSIGLPATLGECVARNVAGPDGRPFIEYVEALTIVTADGELRRTNRSLQPELFCAAIGGQGIVGAVYSITLRINTLFAAFADAVPPVRLDEAAAEPSGPVLAITLMVPPPQLDEFLAAMRRVLDDYRLPVSSLSVRRALPESESLLRWATEELAIVELAFPDKGTLPARTAATQVTRALVDAAIACGGRFDLACGFGASRTQVEAAYPAFSAFLAEKRRYDPQERLGGAWYQHYAALFRREACLSRWTKA